MQETLTPVRSPEAIYSDLLEIEPKLVWSLVPKNATEQKEAFIAGLIYEPHHEYDRLDDIDFEQRATQLDNIRTEIEEHPSLNPISKPVYHEFVERYIKSNRLLWVAKMLKAESSETERITALEAEYKNLNREIYGEPDNETFASILHDRLSSLSVSESDCAAQVIHDELLVMTEGLGLESPVERFRPAETTTAAVEVAALALYEGLLSHVPKQTEPFSKEQVQQILAEILSEEFGESAAGWQVVLDKAISIEVRAAEKRIRIPDGMRPITVEKLRGTIVHELGVHVLRSIRGAETDMDLLAVGLAGYYDAEEGMGMVMQQIVTGGYKEAGLGLYTIAGYMNVGHNFRETFEMVWRLNALEAYTSGTDVGEAAITKAKNAAYQSVMRIARGTDRLSLNKDLAYFNGARSIWQYFEKYAGDEIMLNIALLGKLDPQSNMHRRVALETRSR